MESTGTYWQSLYAVLMSKGFHVVLCNGKFNKNIKGKKNDVMDCQWIQKLYTLGLFTSSFLPDGKTEQLRTYCRHRSNLLYNSASTSRKMQKYLRLLNLRLDVSHNAKEMKITLIIFIVLFISLTSYSHSKEICNKNKICR